MDSVEGIMHVFGHVANDALQRDSKPGRATAPAGIGFDGSFARFFQAFGCRLRHGFAGAAGLAFIGDLVPLNHAGQNGDGCA